MADETPTRQETVEANIEAVLTKYGDENWVKLMGVCLQDISVSLAMLVDNTPST
jgi:hypothetical protein